MNQGLELAKKSETIHTQEIVHERLISHIDEFLAEYTEMIEPGILEQIPTILTREQETLTKKWNSSFADNKVTYDKFKRRFMSGDARGTAGEFVASRHWGSRYAFPQELENSPLGKKLVREATTAHVCDTVTRKLNHVLATELATSYEDRDMGKAEAFRSIGKRSAETHTNEQLGILAEGVIQGTLERLAIDYENLGLSILPGNAAQDVLQKIDFVITTKQKKQGVGVETVDPLYNEKHIGVQFTTNTSKESEKRDQIKKSKARGMTVDDIVYVALDYTTLVAAVAAWDKAGKPLVGPWGFLDTTTKQGVLKGLLESVLTEEQLASVLKQT